MKSEILKDKNNLHITLTCEHCGEPISLISAEFGMDCMNHCEEKAYNRRMAVETKYGPGSYKEPYNPPENT
jgi:ferredoxin